VHRASDIDIHKPTISQTVAAPVERTITIPAEANAAASSTSSSHSELSGTDEHTVHRASDIDIQKPTISQTFAAHVDYATPAPIPFAIQYNTRLRSICVHVSLAFARSVASSLRSGASVLSSHAPGAVAGGPVGPACAGA